MSGNTEGIYWGTGHIIKDHMSLSLEWKGKINSALRLFTYIALL